MIEWINYWSEFFIEKPDKSERICRAKAGELEQLIQRSDAGAVKPDEPILRQKAFVERMLDELGEARRLTERLVSLTEQERRVQAENATGDIERLCFSAFLDLEEPLYEKLILDTAFSDEASVLIQYDDLYRLLSRGMFWDNPDKLKLIASAATSMVYWNRSSTELILFQTELMGALAGCREFDEAIRIFGILHSYDPANITVLMTLAFELNKAGYRDAGLLLSEKAFLVIDYVGDESGCAEWFVKQKWLDAQKKPRGDNNIKPASFQAELEAALAVPLLNPPRPLSKVVCDLNPNFFSLPRKVPFPYKNERDNRPIGEKEPWGFYQRDSDTELLECLTIQGVFVDFDLAQEILLRGSRMVPGLCEVLTARFEENDDKFWGSVHALILLGILGDVSAFDDVVRAFQTGLGDTDYSTGFGGLVMAGMGEEIIPKVETLIADQAEDWELQFILADALFFLGAENPPLRDKILQTVHRIMAAAISKEQSLTATWITVAFAHSADDQLRRQFDDASDMRLIDDTVIDSSDWDPKNREADWQPWDRRQNVDSLIEHFYPANLRRQRSIDNDDTVMEKSFDDLVKHFGINREPKIVPGKKKSGNKQKQKRKQAKQNKRKNRKRK